MRYYDSECSAHAELKSTSLTGVLTEPVTVLYFEDQLSNADEVIKLQGSKQSSTHR